MITKNVGVQSIRSYKTQDGTLAEVISFESLNPHSSSYSFEMTSISEGEGRKFRIRLGEKLGSDYLQ